MIYKQLLKELEFRDFIIRSEGIRHMFTSPQFKRWFDGSEVVDRKTGNPLICFHSSINEHGENFKHFRPFSHFGTFRAAEDNINLKANTSNYISMYPVVLNIKNPLEIEDIGVSHTNAIQYLYSMYKAKGIDKNDVLEYVKEAFSRYEPKFKPNIAYQNFPELVQYITKKITYDLKYLDTGEPIDLIVNKYAGAPTELNNAESYKQLVTFIRKNGYDGFKYRNSVEDRGSISWIILSSRQVLPLYGNHLKNLYGDEFRNRITNTRRSYGLQ